MVHGARSSLQSIREDSPLRKGPSADDDAQNLLLFSRPVVSDSLWPHGLQNSRPPCPSPSLRVCPSSCPLNRWCHPTISSSVAFFSFCLHSFSASGSFPMSWLFASSGQNIEASSSASVLPKTIQGWFTLGLTGLISLVWSLWLQTLNCNSLLILNKPVFPREIPVSPFTCLSGQHFGGPCGDQRRSSKAPNIVSKQMWYPQLTPLSLLSHWP